MWYRDMADSMLQLVRSIPPVLRATLLAVIALVWTFILTLLVFGKASSVFHGFARVDDVNAAMRALSRRVDQTNARISSMRHSDDQHWANQAADSIMQMDQQKCSLPPGRVRALYDSLISKRVDEYYNLTGKQYILPPCDAW